MKMIFKNPTDLIDCKKMSSFYPIISEWNFNFGSLCQGVIFDAEDQPDILTPLSQNGASRDEHSKNCGPFIPEQESPLQRPRPPERLGSPRKRSFQNRWSQRLSSAVIINRSPNNFTNQRLTPLFLRNAYIWIFYRVVTSLYQIDFLSELYVNIIIEKELVLFKLKVKPF